MEIRVHKPSPADTKLSRIAFHLWRLRKQAVRFGYASDYRDFDAAFHLVEGLRKKVRLEEKAQRAKAREQEHLEQKAA